MRRGGRRKSQWEEQLWLWLEAEQPGQWLREVEFHPTRKWRFDFANWDKKVAIEVDGLVASGRGGHQTMKGYHNDRVKDAEAMCLGWKVLRVDPKMMRNGQAYVYIRHLTRTG